MCQYRYYYYGGCQHQETVLYSLCRDAAAIERSQSPPECDEEGADEATPDATSIKKLATPPPRLSPAISSPSPADSNSSAPTSLISLTSLSEPGQDITSISQHPSDFQHIFSLSPTKQAEHNMSALAVFSGMNIRGMISGKPNQTFSSAKTIASHGAGILEENHHTPVGHPQHGQSGSRQRGDGSWELLTSNETSKSNSTERYVELQDIAASGHGEPEASGEHVDMYDSLSSELETLKNKVDDMKKEDFEIRTKTPQSPSPGSKKVAASSVSPRGNASVRCKITAPSQKSANTTPQSALENRQPQSASIHLNGDHRSPKSCSMSPSAELSKGSPHFAQPTVAAVMRRETVRRDSAIYQGSATPDGSPSKSTRSSARRQLRRAPLPGGWTDAADHQNAASWATETSAAGAAPNRPTTQRDAGANHGEETINQEQSVRKKTSTSYMSPTKATTLRNIATMGQENIKRTPPRLARAGPLSDINTIVSPAREMQIAESIVSDSGSEKIITETNKNRAAAQSFATQAGRYARSDNKSPIGIIPSELRRRMTVGVSVADVLSQHARSSGLPSVRNTTRTRRESTGDLLNPIRARLNKVGLLSGGIYQCDVAGQNNSATTTQPFEQSTPETSVKSMEQSRPIAESKPAFQPPHRRLWAAKAIEAMSAAPVVNSAGYDMPMPPPSLRATAAEFTPMSKSRMSRPPFTTPTSTVHDWDTALKFRTAEEWASLSPDDKRLIQAARHFQRSGGEVPCGRVAKQDHWRNIMMQHLATQEGPLMSYAGVYGTGGIAAQNLNPLQDAGMNDLRWTVQNKNGGEAPMHFGGSSPSPIPRLSDFSPHRVPIFPPNSWTIGADAQYQKTFGWTGGAGREIKFVGYGPDAERDPYTPVSFNFRGGNSRSCSSNRNEIGPRMIGEDSHDGSPSAPLAPRSKAQWAKLKKYPKMPCKNVEITHAVELLPIPGQMPIAGYCNDCACDDH